jgi:hypothetical protein
VGKSAEIQGETFHPSPPYFLIFLYPFHTSVSFPPLFVRRLNYAIPLSMAHFCIQNCHVQVCEDENGIKHAHSLGKMQSSVVSEPCCKVQLTLLENNFSHLIQEIRQYNDYAMGYTTEESGIDSRQMLMILFSSTASRQTPRSTQPPIQRVPGNTPLE